MEGKYANKEILTAGIALAILVFSANVVMPAVGAIILVASATKTATIMVAAAGVMTATGMGIATSTLNGVRDASAMNRQVDTTAVMIGIASAAILIGFGVGVA